MRAVNPEIINSFLEDHTIAELAVKTGCSVQLLVNLKSGRYKKRIRPMTVKCLCRALNVHEDELLRPESEVEAILNGCPTSN